MRKASITVSTDAIMQPGLAPSLRLVYIQLMALDDGERSADDVVRVLAELNMWKPKTVISYLGELRRTWKLVRFENGRYEAVENLTEHRKAVTTEALDKIAGPAK